MKKIFLPIIFISTLTKAQENVISPAVPFLLVAADSRSAGLGDLGASSTPDVYSMQWNPAKYAFSPDRHLIAVGYTPYLTELVSDVSLGLLAYSFKINDRSAIATTFRYFGLGNIDMRITGEEDEVVRPVTPNELALDAAYALKLSNNVSVSVAGRYIRSSLKVPDETGDSTASNSFAVDISTYYMSDEIIYQQFTGMWKVGFNFQNMGPKMNYNNDVTSSEFLPANMRLGTGFDFIFDSYNKLCFNLELSKLMVPTPQNPDLDGDGNVTDIERSQNNENYNAISWSAGIPLSFHDAPGGFSEELREIAYSFGTEFDYQRLFFFRLGYFYENPYKGNREFVSLGAGFKYTNIQADLSYMFSMSDVKNPLENTLRLSVAFSFGDMEKKSK